MSQYFRWPDEIYQWTQSKEPDAIVGLAGTCSGCPLSTCHNELDSEKHTWEFGATTALCDERIVNMMPYPSYISLIMDKVDEFPEEHPVTAREFLVILNIVYQELPVLRESEKL